MSGHGGERDGGGGTLSNTGLQCRTTNCHPTDLCQPVLYRMQGKLDVADKIVPPCRRPEQSRDLSAVGVGAPGHGTDGPTPVLRCEDDNRCEVSVDT